MPVMFKDGLVLFASSAPGVVAMDPACCCGGVACEAYYEFEAHVVAGVGVTVNHVNTSPGPAGTVTPPPVVGAWTFDNGGGSECFYRQWVGPVSFEGAAGAEPGLECETAASAHIPPAPDGSGLTCPEGAGALASTSVGPSFALDENPEAVATETRRLRAGGCCHSHDT